jgi:hypothetical protein
VAAIGAIAAVLYSKNESRAAVLKQLKRKQAHAREARQEEHDAIYDYVLSSYGLNRNLRAGKSVEDLDERQRTIAKGLDSWIKDRPGEQGRYVRGIPEKAGSAWNTVKAGDVITDEGFISFTRNVAKAEKFALPEGLDSRGSAIIIVASGKAYKLPYHIKNSYGRGIGNDIKSEKEFLLPRGTQFTVKRVSEVVKSITRRQGTTEIKYRMVYVDIVDSASPRIDAPEGAARLAKRRQQPFGTPLARSL